MKRSLLALMLLVPLAAGAQIAGNGGGGGGGGGDASAANQDEQTALLTTIDGDTSVLGATGDAAATTTGTISAKLRQIAAGIPITIVPADPFGVNADAASATGSISAKLRFIASTGIPITGTVTVGSHAVTNAGTFLTQENGAALTALQLIDDGVYTDDTSTHATGTSKGYGIMAAATPTDTAVNANDIGMVGMTLNRELYVSLATALPAGTNGIGKLTANSGVDIGDVDVTTVGTITPGTAATSLGKAEDAVAASGDTGVAALAVRQDAIAANEATGDYATLKVNSNGRLYVDAERDGQWSYAAASGGIVNTTGITVKTAAGGSVRNYVDAIDCVNTHASTTTAIVLRDGAAGTVLYRQTAIFQSGFVKVFEVPIRGTANTLIEIAEETTTATNGVTCNVQGHTGL